VIPLPRAARGRAGRGLGFSVAINQPLLNSSQDHLADRVRVSQYIWVPEPQDLEALASQPFRSPLVVVALGMLAAIDLDNEACVEANEIRDIWAEWILPPEVRPGEPMAAKPVPKRPLCFRHHPSKLPGEVVGFRAYGHAATTYQTPLSRSAPRCARERGLSALGGRDVALRRLDPAAPPRHI